MSNIIRVRKTNQAWHETFCIIPEIIRNSIEFHVNRFSKTKKAILNYFLNTHYVFKGSLYFRQDTIAEAIGCERETVNRLLLELEEEKFLISNYRHKTSCLYKISRTLYDPFIQSRIGHIFPICRDRSELLLAGVNHKNVTQCINKKYIDIKGIKKISFDIEKACNGLRGSQRGISMALRGMNFTEQEMIRASAFPDCALHYAKEHLKPMAKNPFAYFFKVCFDFCNRRGLVPNWGWANKLKDLFETEKPVAQNNIFEISNAPRGNPQMERRVPEYDAFVEEDESDDVYHPKRPLQRRTVTIVKESRRSPEGISPMVHFEHKPDRLMKLQELQNQLAKYDAMPDKVLAKLFATGLMDRQAKLINELTPSELAFWNSGK